MPRGVSLLVFAGWLALVANASADIVWSGTQYQRASFDVSAIDINQDGTDDFTFDQSMLSFYKIFWIEPVDGQVVITSDDLNPSMSIPLPSGTVIGSKLNNPAHVWENEESQLFAGGAEQETPFFFGYFADTNGYLGISFNVEESTHYGWIKMSHDRTKPSPYDKSLMIHGWAWETESETPIIAGAIPEPSSGILTMIGTLSLLQLARSRRRRKQGRMPMPKFRSPQVRCGFSAEKCVVPVLCGNADRISALRSRSRTPKASTTPEKW